METGPNRIDHLFQLLEDFDRRPAIFEEAMRQPLSEQSDYMVELNQRQLDDGTRSDGSFLPPYSPYTVVLKEKKGQQTHPMNLEDTGSWRRLMKAKLYGNKFEIQSDDPKDEMLQDKFGEEIEGLTEEHIAEVGERAKPGILNNLRNYFIL
jgi:hypothetical protein